ncbi:MAG: DUF4080 domain-containing protein [Planctomycetota bacterium]
MRVVWLDIGSSYSHGSVALPLLHLAALREAVSRGACREASAIEWKAVRGTTSEDVHTLAVQAAALEPELVLSSLYLFNRESVLRVLGRLRALLPRCLFLLGGPEFLGDNEAFLRHQHCVTAVARGEGEKVLPSFLTSLRDPESWTAIPGLCWIDAAGHYHDNGVAHLDETSWRALPSPASSEFFEWSRAFIHVETSRGCTQHCSFCTSARTGAVRWQDLGQVREILREARARGVREVRLLDRTFNANLTKAEERLRLFLDEFADFRFHLEVHPAFLPERLRHLFKAAPPGLFHLEVGLQTTHREALAACERTADAAASWEGLEFLCSCKNLAVHVDLLAGLPHLPFDHLVHDLVQVSLLEPAEIQLELLKILPGTPIVSEVNRHRIVHATDPPYEVLETSTMSAQEIEVARGLSVLVDKFYNSALLRPVVVAAVRQNEHFYTELLEYLRGVTDLAQPAGLERRGLLLHQFLAARDPESASLLEFEWLRGGLPPAKGPGRVTRWGAAIPLRATLVAGALPERLDESRIWMLERRGAREWFVFEGRRERRLPVAIYREASPAAAS